MAEWIENFISDYLADLGATPSTNGEMVLPECPFCGKAKHCYVNVEPRTDPITGEERHAGRWVCFRCGRGGRGFASLLAELEGLTYAQARQRIDRAKLGGQYAWKGKAFREALEAPVEEEAPSPLPEHFELIWKAEKRKWLWPRYLNACAERGACEDQKMIGRDRFICPDHRSVPREIVRSEELGFCREGKHANRVIFPIHCPGGESFTARAVHRWQEPRYLAGPGAGNLLLGWEKLPETPETIVLVEGPFDRLRVIEAGFVALALMGKELRRAQQAMLRAVRARFVVLLDPEAAEDATLIAMKLGGGMVGRLARMRDPADSRPEAIVDAIASARPADEVAAEIAHERFAKLLDLDL